MENPGNYSQLCQELAPSSRLTLNPGTLELQPPNPKSGSVYQWASTTPGTPKGSTASHFVTQPHQKVASTQGRAWQPTGTQAIKPTRPPTLSAHHKSRIHIAAKGTPKACSLGEERGICCWDAEDVSYRGHFSKVRKCNKCNRYIKIQTAT